MNHETLTEMSLGLPEVVELGATAPRPMAED
jgi:hypothetical protein